MKMIKRIKLLSLVTLFIGQIYATRITTRPIVMSELQPSVQNIVELSRASLDKIDMLTVDNFLTIPRNYGVTPGTPGVVPGTVIPVLPVQGARDIDGDAPALLKATDTRIRETFIEPYKDAAGRDILRVFQIYDRLHSTPLETSKIAAAFAVTAGGPVTLAVADIGHLNTGLGMIAAALPATNTSGLLGFIANYNAMPGANLVNDLNFLTDLARDIIGMTVVDKKLKVVRAFLDYTAQAPQAVPAAGTGAAAGQPIAGSYAEAIGAIIRGTAPIVAEGTLVECVTDFITALAADVSIAPLTPMEMIVGRAGAVHPIRGIGHRFTPVLASLFCELFTLGAYDADGNCHGGCDYLMRYNVKLIDTLDPLGAAAHVTTGANPSIAANNRIFQAEVALQKIQLSEGILGDNPLQWINSPAMFAPGAAGIAAVAERALVFDAGAVGAAAAVAADADATTVADVFDAAFPGKTFNVATAGHIFIKQLQVCVTGTKLLFNVGSLVNYIQGQKLPTTTQFSLRAVSGAPGAITLGVPPMPAIGAAPARPAIAPAAAAVAAPANICLPNFINIDTHTAINLAAGVATNRVQIDGTPNDMPLRVIYQARTIFAAAANGTDASGSIPEFFGIGYVHAAATPAAAAQDAANKAIKVLSSILPTSVRLDLYAVPAPLPNSMILIGTAGAIYPGGAANAVVKNTPVAIKFLDEKKQPTALANI